MSDRLLYRDGLIYSIDTGMPVAKVYGTKPDAKGFELVEKINDHDRLNADITRLLRAATPRHLSSIPTVDQAVTRITAWRDTCARMWPDLQDHIPRDTDAVPTAEIALQKETRRANGAILAFRESEDDVTRQRERAQEAESRVKERDSEIAALGSRITELEAGKKAALEMAHSANKRADEANAQCDSLSGLLFGVGD